LVRVEVLDASGKWNRVNEFDETQIDISLEEFESTP